MSATLLLLFLAAGLVLASLRRVPEGMAYTVHRLGSYARTLPSGVHWVLPLIERVAHRVSLKGRALTLEHLKAQDAESAPPVSGRVYFQVIDAERADGAIDRIDDTLLECASATLAELAPVARELAESEFNRSIKDGMNQRLAACGVVVIRAQLQREYERHAA
jgi:regulator of protease activity HflC (stomatin/prohibitin superfamily)